MPKVTADNAVQVEGLTALRLGLKKIGPEWPKKLGEVNQSVGQLVVDEAKSRADAQGGVARKAGESLKASKAASAAIVQVGGNRYPFALGAEFGAKKYRQFQPWRGNQFQPSASGVGYFLHPAIRARLGEIEQQYLDAITDLSREAFPTPL